MQPRDDGSWLPAMDGRSRRPARRAVAIAAMSAVAVVAGLAGAVVLLGALPPGTTVAGERVSSVADSLAAARTAASSAEALAFAVSGPSGERAIVRGDDVDVTVDAPGTAARLDGAAVLPAWLRRLAGTRTTVPPSFDVPPATAFDEAAATVSTDPVPASVDVTGARPEPVPPQPGMRVTGEEVRGAVVEALGRLEGPPGTWPDVVDVAVAGAAVPSPITHEDATAAVAWIEELSRAVVRVQAPRPPAVGTTQPAATTDVVGMDVTGVELQALLRVEPRPDAPAGSRLEVVPDATRMPERLAALLDAVEVPPAVEAEVVGATPPPGPDDDVEDVTGIGGEVVFHAISGGFEVDRAATAAAIVDVAEVGDGVASVVGRPPPEVDPAELGIVEPVSTFTTFFPAGQSRVQNIHRIAELVDGTVIPAGAPYELNHAVGRRTRENGFTLGGAIVDGELVSAIGGGVSQFATTFLNAAWLSGIELVEFKPHSRYFERYPAGREATIDFPDVDLEVRNDTPAAVLVDTAVTETSVTVTFWSTPYWTVETITGPRSHPGASFRITVDRIRTAPDGTSERESYTTLYQPPL